MNPAYNTFLEDQRNTVSLNLAFTSIWTWDFFVTALGEECALMAEYKVTFPQVIYMIARLSSITCIAAASVVSGLSENKYFYTQEEASCTPQTLLIGWAFTISIATNSLLMFFRVRAVFFHSTPMIVAFGLLWVIVLGGALTVPVSLTETEGGFGMALPLCFNFGFPSYVFSAYIITAVYDALLFLAVTYRLLFYYLYIDDRTSRLKSFFSGEGLGLISKTLLQTGQLYYLVTVGMNVLNMVALFSPNIPFLPGAANSVFMVPCVAVTNVMASMVYRQLKLGILRQDPWNESRQQSTHTLRGGLRFIRLTSPTVR